MLQNVIVRTTIVALLICAAEIQMAWSKDSKSDFSNVKARAEKLYKEGSYARVHKLYESVDQKQIKSDQLRWVKFRLADTLWRSQAASQSRDTTKLDQARNDLNTLLQEVKREEDKDLVWGKAQESLGDYWWTRRQSHNWHTAWPHYQNALDWWAGSKDIALARYHYLNIIWKATDPSWRKEYNYYGNAIPVQYLKNVLEIAETEEDRAKTHFWIAMTTRNYGHNWDQRRTVSEEFEKAIQFGKKADWYDEALFYYADWLANRGEVMRGENGQWFQKQNYPKALELYLRIINEFEKGETRFYDQAQNAIKQITEPTLTLSVSNIFFPESEIEYHLNWRNVKEANFAIYPISLTEDISMKKSKDSSYTWIKNAAYKNKKPLKSWKHSLKNDGVHQPHNETIRMEKPLPQGAYVIEAKTDTITIHEIILVSDASLILKTAGAQALAYFCDARNSAPIPHATVVIWERYYDKNKWRWRKHEQTSNQDGIAVFDFDKTAHNLDLFAAASSENRQSFSQGNAYPTPSSQESWRIYAFTDRPAYRPKEEVQWKLIARSYDGSVYHTPSDQVVEYEIKDPRGTTVKKDNATLNAFGSAWGKLELTEDMPLGAYNVSFWTENRKTGIGSATLFRLEEYKKPEYKVSVQTPEKDGKKKSFQLGDRVEIEVQAEYYFGAPVSNAKVEVVIYQKPFYHWWAPPRPYPWFYSNLGRHYNQSRYYGGGHGQVFKREVIQTDDEGKAHLEFDTPSNVWQDFEYYVEARVTDSSRREITGGDSIRVTRQRYYIYPEPGHYLYRPQDKVEVQFKALDANKEPVEVSGEVAITRQRWIEVWIDPNGNEVQGDALKKVREATSIFPPPIQDPKDRPWRLKFQGYEQDDIFKKTIKTTKEGEATLTFTPEQEGYYRIRWESAEKNETPVVGETSVWVATTASSELGYRHGGIGIILDKDTFKAGEKVPVMLTAPTNDRYVLFTVEGEDLYDYQLVHLEGTVKLLQLDVDEQYVPNVFLSAASTHDGQLLTETKEVIVPPTKQYLEIEVEPNQKEYQPREKGTWTVTALDHEGKPVEAEIALGVVDESIYYIQNDLAGDPREVFYGSKRAQRVQTQSTFQYKSFRKIIDRKRSQTGRKDKNQELRSRDNDYRAELDDISLNAQSSVAGEAAFGRAPSPVMEESAVFANGKLSAKAKGAKRIVGKDDAKKEGLESFHPVDREAEKTGAGDSSVQVRSDFRSTTFWGPDIVTDTNGKATVEVQYPDSLTAWKTTARVATGDNKFGIATANVRTRQPLIVQLQAPRFFVVGDVLTVSAVIHNNTNELQTVTPILEANGLTILGRMFHSVPKPNQNPPVEIAANDSALINWQVAVEEPGTAKLKVTARAGSFGDAMEKSYLVHEHGISKLVVKSGKAHGDDITINLEIPKERKPDSTKLIVQITPSLAITMLDALPYLIDYPYGCVEQTMSRFLPAVIVSKTLSDLGLEPEDIAGKIFGGIETQHTSKTQKKGKRDLAKLDAMVEKGLQRLYDFQHSDGGWGWWKKDESDHFMTAYVLWGLTLAQDSGVSLKSETLDKAAEFLNKEIVESETQLDRQAWILHALAAYHQKTQQKQIHRFQKKAFENLWENRDQLNAYSRALLALSAYHYGFSAKAETLVRNLENGVKQDDSPDTSIVQRGPQSSSPHVMGTAHWGEDGLFWRWSEGGVEATAFSLYALTQIDPENALVEPVTNWLIKNRRGSQWSNTRDTAITVLALNEYLKKSAELSTTTSYELLVNGKSITTQTITPENILDIPSQFEIDPKLIGNASETSIQIIRKNSKSPIYFSTYAEFFSLEEPITPAGNEIFVRRQYHKIVGRPTLLKGYQYEKEPLNDGDTIASGERVECVITIESKNNYEYLIFEDLKPAGFEATQIQSGAALHAKQLKSGIAGQHQTQSTRESKDYTGRRQWVYQELRDRKVAMFLSKLPEGVWEIRYELRAEAPGKFHALPVLGHAMYVPEIRCNGQEIRVTIEDTQPFLSP